MLQPTAYNEPSKFLGRWRSTPLFDAYTVLGLLGIPLVALQPLKLDQDPSPLWVLGLELVLVGLAAVVAFFLYMQMPADGGRRYAFHFIAVFGTLIFVISAPRFWPVLAFAVLGYLFVGIYLGAKWRKIVRGPLD